MGREITDAQVRQIVDSVKWGRIIVVKEAGRITRLEKTEVLKAEDIKSDR